MFLSTRKTSTPWPRPGPPRYGNGKEDLGNRRSNSLLKSRRARAGQYSITPAKLLRHSQLSLTTRVEDPAMREEDVDFENY